MRIAGRNVRVIEDPTLPPGTIYLVNLDYMDPESRRLIEELFDDDEE